MATASSEPSPERAASIRSTRTLVSLTVAPAVEVVALGVGMPVLALYQPLALGVFWNTGAFGVVQAGAAFAASGISGPAREH